MDKVNGIFKVVIQMEDKGSYLSFKEALRVFLSESDRIVKEGTSFQVLESMCWIEFNDDPKTIMYFYALREMADELGILVDGKLVG